MELYDISKYSDDELYLLLDLDNPTDRVLEAKIIQMINKYNLMDTDSGKQLTRLFKDIYDHFFPSSSDDEDDMQETDRKEGFINFSGTQGLPDSVNDGVDKQLFTKVTNNPNNTNATNVGNVMSEGIQIKSDTTNYAEKNQSTTKIMIPEMETKTNTITKQIDYIPGKLNPLLKQTIKRIISIDSQYRTDKSGLSTQFTFNLSEPLKDVLALRLYSVHIPYTWYTITRNYGSNFFYLKGNVPGIDTGNFDYQLQIDAGNYTPTELVNSINTQIHTLKTTYTDVSFGNFGLNYVSSSCLTTMTIDLTNIYNETNYSMDFETWPGPFLLDSSGNPIKYTPNLLDETGKVVRYNGNTTLDAFLGFNYQSYTPNSICGNRNLPLIVNSPADSTSSIYKLDNSNNYFDVIQYQGPNEYNNNPLNTIRISLNMVGFYTRNVIRDAVNALFETNPYLMGSTLIRKDILADIEDFGHSYFKMILVLNKLNTISTLPDIKTVVIFPDETGYIYPVWVNNVYQSCFSFKSTINELNNILAESNSLQTNYIINSNPYFILKCISPGYINPNTIQNGVIDPSLNYNVYKNMQVNAPNNASHNYNDYKIVVPNSTILGGYSFLQYLNAINEGINNNQNLNNIVSSIKIDNDTTINKVFFSIDFNNILNETEYILDLSGSELNTRYGLGGNTTLFDLNESNIIQGEPIDILSSYGIVGNIATIKSKPNTTHEFADDWVVEPVDLTVNYDIVRFVSKINASFQAFSDASFSKPLTLVNLTYAINELDGKIQFTLEVKIEKTLNENNYQLIFYDLSANENGWDNNVNNPRNSWNYNLKMSRQIYNLFEEKPTDQNFVNIYGNSVISGYTMTLRRDTYINFKALTNGITTNAIKYNADLDASFNYNDIQIKIPKASSSNNFQYTRQELFNIINNAFNSNPLTAGSSISTYTVNVGGTLFDYNKIRLNINKIYTTKDYRVVFYDPFSFVKCYFGSKGARNTTWDATLGWILGFRLYTEYNLSDYIKENTQTAVITGDAATITNLYNYFLIVLDDYTQSHLNDGLVTLTNQENNIPLPSYATRTNAQCINDANDTTSNLTNNQLYAVNEIIKARQSVQKTYSMGPFIQDIFGLIPMKVSGMQSGGTYIEFGGTLQNQERTYFGPVNITRMTIQLMTDRGDLVDLNNANWSFSLICEQLYTPPNLTT